MKLLQVFDCSGQFEPTYAYSKCDTGSVDANKRLIRNLLSIGRSSVDQWHVLPPGCLWTQQRDEPLSALPRADFKSWRLQFNSLRNFMSWNRPSSIPHELHTSLNTQTDPACYANSTYTSFSGTEAEHIDECRKLFADRELQNQLFQSFDVANATFVDRIDECIENSCAALRGCSVRLESSHPAKIESICLLEFYRFSKLSTGKSSLGAVDVHGLPNECAEVLYKSFSKLGKKKVGAPSTAVLPIGLLQSSTPSTEFQVPWKGCSLV